MLTWLKDNAPVIGALAAALLVLVAILQLLVAGPINRGFDDLRSEMSSRFEAVDRRFEAVDKRFDDLRSEMRGRLSDLRSDMNIRFGDLRSDMNRGFEAVDQRFEAVDQRFEAVDQRLDAMDQRLGRLETGVSGLRTLSDRVSRNEGQIDLLREQLRTVDAPTP